jgi:hypothetical protein
MAYRTQGGKVLLKNGLVACGCCDNGIPCATSGVMQNYFGDNLEYAILVPITAEQRALYLTNGATIQQSVASSPFSISATRSDGATHQITGGVAPRVVNQTQPTPICLIQRFYLGAWNVNNVFTFSPFAPVSYSFTQSDWDGLLLVAFVDSMPNHMLVGFAYWHFINAAGFPFNLELVVAGTTQELDKSQFGFSCSSFKPGAIESIWWNGLLAPGETMLPVPSGAGFSVQANVTANSVSLPIQDTPIFYFVHKPSENSVVPQGTWTLNSLSAQLNLTVAINPISPAP